MRGKGAPASSVGENKADGSPYVPRENSPPGTLYSGFSAVPGALLPWYVTGFCEGEGTFTYNRNGPSNVALVFAVKLMAKDSALLERLRRFFGCGNIYKIKARFSKKFNTRSKASAYFRVTKAADLLKVVSHFDQYPLEGKKARSYVLWRAAVMLKQHRRHVDRERLDRILYFLSRLQNTRRAWEDARE